MGSFISFSNLGYDVDPFSFVADVHFATIISNGCGVSYVREPSTEKETDPCR